MFLQNVIHLLFLECLYVSVFLHFEAHTFFMRSKIIPNTFQMKFFVNHITNKINIIWNCFKVEMWSIESKCQVTKTNKSDGSFVEVSENFLHLDSLRNVNRTQPKFNVKHKATEKTTL